MSVFWNYCTEGIIWRLIPDHKNFIIGEVRDTVNKVATFFCIELKTGKTLWSGLSVQENWWVGIETLWNNYLILHEYSQPDLPNHKSFHVIDIINGKILWSNKELTYSHCEDKCLIAKKENFKKTSYIKLNIDTGEIVNEFDFDNYTKHNNPDYESNFISPQIYSEENIQNDGIRNYIDKLSKTKNIISPVDILSIKDFFIIGLSENISNDSLINNLIDYVIILNSNGHIIIEEIINKNGRFPVTPRFFVKNDFLIFVKNKNVLSAVKL